MPLIPFDIINNNIDTYLDKNSTKSQKIYWIVLFTVTVTLISLPFIYIDLSVQEPGIIRPIGEKTEIMAPITEFVDSIYLREGIKIRKGDTILTLRSTVSNSKIDYQKIRIKDFNDHLHDLKYLVTGTRPGVFKSNTRKQEFLYFEKLKKEHNTTLKKAKSDLDRHKVLFENKVISDEEYQNYSFDYENARNKLESIIDNQISKWQADLNAYSNSNEEMESMLEREKKEKDVYAIVSPINGTVEQFRGIYKNSNIQAGTTVAIISPDSTLFIEVYVSPKNIGYIQIGMPVNIQVESFNYNEWGTISGKVLEISSDFFINNSKEQQSYYIVKCSIDKEYLTHKRGIIGQLKKGMTVASHFMITRRSIFDLLYQKMDNWINPTQYNASTNN